MSSLNWKRILERHVATDQRVATMAQLACFVSAPGVMILALRGTVRFGRTPGEIFLGVLASAVLALLLVILGLLMPLAHKRIEQ